MRLCQAVECMASTCLFFLQLFNTVYQSINLILPTNQPPPPLVPSHPPPLVPRPCANPPPPRCRVHYLRFALFAALSVCFSTNSSQS